MALTNMHSDLRFNPSSGLCINLFIYVDPLFCILGCNIYAGPLFCILGCNESVLWLHLVGTDFKTFKVQSSCSSKRGFVCNYPSPVQLGDEGKETSTNKFMILY